MNKTKVAFSIVDLLVGLAVLMILAALFVPHFIPPTAAAKSVTPAHRAAPLRPGR